MNLLQLRTQAVEISGRYDLVNNAVNFVDNGMDFYIEQGQRYLERQLSIPPTNAKFFKDLSVGDYIVTFKKARAIDEVWILDSTSRTQLEKITKDEMRKYVYTVPISDATRSTPTCYYTIGLRRSPDDEDGSGDSTLLQSFLDTRSPSDPDYTGIMLYPPVDKTYGLEVVGLFYDLFPDDASSNYWTVNYPALLIMSTLRQLEIMYKGSKTVTAWDKVIAAELDGIEKDAIEDEISHIDQMEG